MEKLPLTLQLVAGILVGIIIGFLIAKVYFLLQIKAHRQSAIDKSSSVILGHVSEKVAPLLPNFPYNYKDLTFIGKGIDYIVFDGLSHKNLQKIVFLEIKSGQSNLNLNEKMIRDCIERGRVSYEIVRIKEEAYRR